MSSLRRYRAVGHLVFASLVVLGVSPAQAEERAPKILGSAPKDFFRPEAVQMRWGKEVHFVVTVLDDNDALQVTPGALPMGARFSPRSRELSWTPTREQIGHYSIDFTVSDGRQSATSTARIHVTENHAPVIGVGGRYHMSKHATGIDINASDPDDDQLSCSIRNLPEGATIANQRTCRVDWSPEENQVGVHRITVEVSDGVATTTKDVDIRYEDDWHSFMLPGVSYSFYRPSAHDDLGVFHGVAVELVVGTWIHRNENHGPSHGRITMKIELLDSTKSEQTVAMVYAAGVDLSFERNPYRRYLIPFFGFDVGGLTQRDAGHHFQVSPRAGFYLWSSRNVFATVSGGYMVVPGAIESLNGWRIGAGLNLTLW